MDEIHRLDGKICMVTGATAGIGRVTAETLAQRGAHVIVVGRNEVKWGKLFQPLVFRRGISPEEGARTSIYLAASPDVQGMTGKYFFRERAMASDEKTHDRQAAARLWQISEQLTGLNS